MRATKLSDLNPNAYCRDCLPEHQAQMIGMGRCARPSVRFYWVAEEGGTNIIGLRPKEKVWSPIMGEIISRKG